MKIRTLIISIILCLPPAAGVESYAQGRGGSRGYHGGGFEQESGRGGHGGDGLGQAAAWLFGIANLPVALSIVLKSLAKTSPEGSSTREAVARANRKQKKYLMKLHYWLNPVAVMAAVTHFLSAECASTAMPELGLGVMLLICLLGFMVLFRRHPASLKRAVFRFHTSPLLFTAGVGILFIGHSMID